MNIRSLACQSIEFLSRARSIVKSPMLGRKLRNTLDAAMFLQVSAVPDVGRRNEEQITILYLNSCFFSLHNSAGKLWGVSHGLYACPQIPIAVCRERIQSLQHEDEQREGDLLFFKIVLSL